ncbi:MAG: dipeptide ABC transporter ATP-binding protein [Pseudochelatococcus sp.]|jgi:peptide/nickel transport system ATP-binding protein|uniref:dipeptide ABC transporter ATP-binding protein n=1 Tax=Pseudochelatococcus sp. TaxID=2020869 RepID=UPI003D8A78C1
MTHTLPSRLHPAGDPAATLVGVEGLGVSYEIASRDAPVHALRDVSFTIRPGEVVAIVGESGSGKSTLAASLVGLLARNARIDDGRVLLDGTDVTRLPESGWRHVRGVRIGFIPQDPGQSFNPVRRVGEQVVEALTVHGVPRREALGRVSRILADVGLADVERVARGFPHELSGGMRQRVLIGIALANNPPLVIADEPTSALDVTVQRQVLDHLARLTRERNTAVLLITHDLGVAFDRADRVIVMQHGRIVETGPAQRLFDNPAHAYTRQLLDAAPGLRRQGALAATPRRAPRPQRPGEPEVILRVSNLAKRFDGGGTAGDRPAVGGISFDVARFGTTSIVGESGSGKSTTARMVLGLETPTGGEVLFEGRAVAAHSRQERRAFRRRVQVVYQNPYASLDPRFTLERIIAEPLHAFRIGTRQSRRERAAELIEAVGLSTAQLSALPAELSGGQRQRVAIARALAIEPELVVLDEPVSALDVSVQAQILALLDRLQRDLGLTYLFISHDLAVVRQISDHVIVLRHGRIVEQGAAETIFGNPAESYTRALLGDTPGQHYLAARQLTVA